MVKETHQKDLNHYFNSQKASSPPPPISYQVSVRTEISIVSTSIMTKPAKNNYHIHTKWI